MSLAILDHVLTDMVLSADLVDLVVHASKQQMPVHYHYHSKALLVLSLTHLSSTVGHSDPDLSYSTLATRTNVYKYSFFFPRTIGDWNFLDTLSLSKPIPHPPVDISSFSCC